ncbi:MAG: ABC transporter substrate-binding protein [Desulfobacteraceae bacterium]|nr:ABC transporter substrate-binding protein [Desulfobacteraceae bacterium]
MKSTGILLIIVIILFSALGTHAENFVKIGLNYPATGPYAAQGLDQIRSAKLAIEKINISGGILGQKVELVIMDTKSQPQIAVQNAVEMIKKDKVKMIFGGASSGVAVAVGKVCQEKQVVFMATITSSNATTRENGHRHTFRVCYNAWMGAKALSSYLNKEYKGKKYFYIVADYTWGWSSEDSIRKFTGTEDQTLHKRILTRLGGDKAEFEKAILLAKMLRPDVLVLVLFGQDMSTAITIANKMGVKKTIQIVVPILELGLAEGAGPKVMENVIGTADWNWKVPYKYNYKAGIKFVEKFAQKYQRYPCWGAATAYTNVIEYAKAVERAQSFNSAKVILALENHKFTSLKDEQIWRAFDHQNVQSVFVVKCKPAEEVLKDKLKLDYFEILGRFPGKDVVQNRLEWETARIGNGKSLSLELLPGESR